MKGKTEKSGPKRVMEQMFDNIAPFYDRLNHLLSFNVDKLWRRRMVRRVAECRPRNILDLAAGTGDLAIMAADKLPTVSVTGVDLSEKMLEVARRKASKRKLDVRVEFVAGDAENLPSSGDEFDAVTVAFGIRNFQNLPAALREMHRVLRNEGRVFLMEFGKPQGKIFSRLYRYYSDRVMPCVGGMVSGNRQAYRYLINSIRTFAEVDVVELMRKAGFEDCERENLTDGVAVIYKGVKRVL